MEIEINGRYKEIYKKINYTLQNVNSSEKHPISAD